VGILVKPTRGCDEGKINRGAHVEEVYIPTSSPPPPHMKTPLFLSDTTIPALSMLLLFRLFDTHHQELVIFF
jgi:hypothetical protein